MEPQRPHFTVVDPRSGTPAADVLEGGNERAPWRPSPRLLRRAAALLVTAGVLAAGAVYVRDVALDRRARNDVRLETGYATGTDTTGADLWVRSTGTGPIELVSLRLLADGYSDTPLGVHLRATEGTVIQLPEGTECPSDPLRPAPRQVVLSVRTERGSVVRRTLALDEAVVERFGDRERRRCGVLPLAESTYVSVVSRQPRAVGISVTFELRNSSVLPLRIQGWRAANGLAFVTQPPVVTLRGTEAPGEPGPASQVTLLMRVDDCRTWQRSFLADGVNNTGDAVFDAGLLATAVAVRDGETEEQFFADSPLQDSEDEHQDDTMRRALARHCPASTSG